MSIPIDSFVGVPYVFYMLFLGRKSVTNFLLIRFSTPLRRRPRYSFGFTHIRTANTGEKEQYRNE